MEIERITLGQYLSLGNKEQIDKYNFVIRYSDTFTIEEDLLEIGDIYQVEYGIIKDIQTDIEGNDFSLLSQIEYALRIKPDIDVYAMFLDDFCRSVSWIVTNTVELLNNEAELLGGGIPSAEEVEAGLDKFNGLGIYLQIRDLSNNDITKIDSIKKLPYEVCFLELYTRKQSRDFQNELNEINRKKITR